MNSALQIGVLGVIVFLLDSVFLYSTHRTVLPVYQAIQKSPVSIRYGSALLCYIVMVCGLYYFIVREKRPIIDAFLLGWLVYGVYDLTVYSVLKQYTLGVAITDWVWGGILFGTSTAIYRAILR
jgi:uncharacterized membrane protein